MIRYKRFIAGSSNGRTQAFGAWYLGPSPSPAASKNREKTKILKNFLKTNAILVALCFYYSKLFKMNFLKNRSKLAIKTLYKF